jgi:hypothetical protein
LSWYFLPVGDVVDGIRKRSGIIPSSRLFLCWLEARKGNIRSQKRRGKVSFRILTKGEGRIGKRDEV